jgi:hypothetical protein
MLDGCFGIRTVVLSNLSFALAVLTGCDGSSPEPHQADAAEPDSGAELRYQDALEPGAWEDMSFEERKRFMRELVVPTVAPMFHDFDAQRFAAVSCKTCHGSGAQAGDFALPSPDVPALNSEALKNPSEELKPIMEFMRNVLKPAVSDLLGKRDMAALRCNACHMNMP